MTTARGFARGGLWQIVSMLPSFAVYPVVVRYLDDVELGAWTLIGAAGFMMALADLGLSTAVRRASVGDDAGLARRTLGLTITVITVITPFAALILWFTMLDFGDLPLELRTEASKASLIMLAGGACGTYLMPHIDFLYARDQANGVAKARMIGILAQVGVLIAGFVNGGGLWVPACAASVSNITQLLMALRAAHSVDKKLPWIPSWHGSRTEALSAFRDGSAALAISAAVSMAIRIDYKVLEWAISRGAVRAGYSAAAASARALTEVGRYGLAGLTIDQAYMVAKQANTTLLRQLGRAEQREKALRVGGIMFCILIVSGMAAITLNGRPFLVFVLGEKADHETVTTVLYILGAAAMLMSTYEIASAMVMLGSRTAWGCAIPILTGSTVNLITSISLAPRFGILAVAGSTALGNAITAVLIWRQARRILHWRRMKVFRLFTPVYVGAAIAIPLATLLRGIAATGPLPSVICCALVTAGGLSGMHFAQRWIETR